MGCTELLTVFYHLVFSYLLSSQPTGEQSESRFKQRHNISQKLIDLWSNCLRARNRGRGLNEF